MNELKTLLTFDGQYVTPEMEYEDLKKLAFDNGRGDISEKMSFYTRAANEHYFLIDIATKNKINRDKILSDIRENTFYSCTYEQWNITNLVRKHKLSSIDIFRALVDSVPFAMGIFDHEKTLMNENEIKKEFNKRADCGYSSFDYWNGIGLKCSFPTDVYDDNTPFELNMRRYNDRNEYKGYEKIINLLYPQENV